MGTAVPSRTKANTASTLAQLTVASGTPTKRKAARSTKYSESWLTTSAAASMSPLLRRTRINLDRNRTATSPPVVTGGIRRSRRKGETAVPIRAPTRRANAARRIISASITNVPRTTPTPTRAVDSSSPDHSPLMASTANETTGRTNLNDMFTMPVSSVESAMSDGANPHELYIA